MPPIAPRPARAAVGRAFPFEKTEGPLVDGGAPPAEGVGDGPAVTVALPPLWEGEVLFPPPAVAVEERQKGVERPADCAVEALWLVLLMVVW